MHIRALYQEAADLLQEKGKFLRAMLLNFLKIFNFCSITYMIIRILGISCFTFLQIQTLSSLMLLFSYSLPNISGMGSPEFSFMLVFAEGLQADAAVVMMYFRLATYYFPFLISILAPLLIRQKLKSDTISKTFTS